MRLEMSALRWSDILLTTLDCELVGHLFLVTASHPVDNHTIYME